MKKRSVILTAIVLFIAVSACSRQPPSGTEEHLVFVEGGRIANTTSNYYGTDIIVPSFYIGKYEVTQKEWTEIMGSNPSAFKGDDLPVEMVSWYDAVEYCNRRSVKEGLQPYYRIDRSQVDPNNESEFDPIKWIVSINEGADGYRLPTEAEWEYAAGGGTSSKSYKYSGSHQADDVSWYWRNAGDRYLTGDWHWPLLENNRNRTRPVGRKKPNELGIYDMSGNVREWCWDWYADPEQGERADRQGGSFRVVKGGGWIGDVTNNEISFRGKFEASGYGPDQGFRVVRGE